MMRYADEQSANMKRSPSSITSRRAELAVETLCQRSASISSADLRRVLANAR